MAKVVKIKSELNRKKNRIWWHSIFSLFFSILFLGIGFAIFSSIRVLSVILLIFSFILFGIYSRKNKEYNILKSGVQGEKQTCDLLRKLPKNFTIITNPVISYKGKENELDTVVIGENGVFIIESKNYRGVVCGKTSEQVWKQIKKGKNSSTYEKEVKNPVRQSDNQRRKMREILNEANINADVFPVLYFVDDNVKLKITDDAKLDIKIINNENTLIEYIINAKSRCKISSSERARIIKFLKN